jgi:hypothetical protein
MKTRDKISRESTLGKNLVDYISALELLIIKKFIRSMKGFVTYSGYTLAARL